MQKIKLSEIITTTTRKKFYKIYHLAQFYSVGITSNFEALKIEKTHTQTKKG